MRKPSLLGGRGFPSPLSLLSLSLLFAFGFLPACAREVGGEIGAQPLPRAPEVFHHFKNLLDLSLGDLTSSLSLVLKPQSSGTEGWVAYLVKVEGGQGADLRVLHFFLDEKGETQFEILNVAGGFKPAVKLLRHPSTGQLLIVVSGEPGGLYLFRQEGKEWRRFPLEEGIVVPFLDAVVDANGAVHVAYIEGIGKNLRYLLWQDESFIFRPQVVDSGYEEGQAIPGGDLDKKVSLDLNLNDEPVISYYDASAGFLRVARYQGFSNQWVWQAVGEAVTGEVLRPDANGQATTRRPFFAIPSQVRLYKNFSPLPVTAYQLLGRQSIGILNYDPGAEYELDSIAPFGNSFNYGQWSSLKVRRDGAYEVSFYDFARGLLGFATNLNPDSNLWSFEIVDAGGTVGDMNALAYAPLFRGNVQIGVYPVVAYYDGSNANLNFAYRSKGSWSLTSLDTIGFAGLFPSIGVSEDAWVVVAYLVTDPLTLVSTLRIVRFIPVQP